MTVRLSRPAGPNDGSRAWPVPGVLFRTGCVMDLHPKDALTLAQYDLRFTFRFNGPELTIACWAAEAFHSTQDRSPKLLRIVSVRCHAVALCPWIEIH